MFVGRISRIAVKGREPSAQLFVFPSLVVLLSSSALLIFLFTARCCLPSQDFTDSPIIDRSWDRFREIRRGLHDSMAYIYTFLENKNKSNVKSKA
jgi:hypothetical protein